MNDCPRGDIRDLLPDLLHDRLDTATRAELEGHVSSCADCAAELQLLRTMQCMLSTPGAVDVSRVAAAVRGGSRHQPATPPARGRRLDWRVAAAAAVLVTGGLTLAVVQRAPRPVMVAAPPAASPQGAPAPAAGPGLMFGGGFADLSDGDIKQLLQDVDSLSALPGVDPAPVLVGVQEGAP